jgi:hypothetical protein
MTAGRAAAFAAPPVRPAIAFCRRQLPDDLVVLGVHDGQAAEPATSCMAARM